MHRISSSAPFFDKRSLNAILKDIELTLKSGVLTGGLHVENFEKKFAEYIGVKYAIAVNSGTSALEIVLRHYDLKGREVIVPTNTFVATPNSVIFAGGKPVFADIREDTLCINVEDVKKKISSKTAGIIVVHIAGLICPQIEEIKEICLDNNLFLIEDAAHVHGATIGNKKAGSLGDAGCFSFYPTKVMTTSEGGMITTDNKEIADSAYCMRSHGQNTDRQMVMLGHNWRMSEIAAIMGIHQLRVLENFVRKRNEIARQYERLLADLKNLSPFRTPANVRHSYYKYPTKVSSKIDVDKLARNLKEKYGIETGNVYYPPCHLHPFYKKNYATSEGQLPIAENVLKKVLCLPMHVGLTKADVEYVSNALHETIL